MMETKFKSVKVIFKDSNYNYITSVNSKATNKSIKKYFVNTVFDVGCYPVENMQKCIKIKIN